jgi:hypothetical protein
MHFSGANMLADDRYDEFLHHIEGGGWVGFPLGT